MAKLTELLQERFRKKDKTKMALLADRAQEGNLTVFSGIFSVKAMEEHEKEKLYALLHRYAYSENEDLSEDVRQLGAIGSEVKAINNQAIILHGERIKKAQSILKKYREGAFSAWLLSVYKNRQTPYNFLQYYDFLSQMPKALHSQIEEMPRQAIYTLASRDAPLEKKENFIRDFQGETKEALISKIRTLFPLGEEDKRKENFADKMIKGLHKILFCCENVRIKISKKNKERLLKLLVRIKGRVESWEATEE